jgi:NAD(P) transhydrogenase subunit beta
MLGLSILELSYIVASITFILGLKMLSHPDTARRGNIIAAAGMFLAIFATIFLYEKEGQKLGNYAWIFGGMIVGTVIGYAMAKKVKMTAMPQMVSFFNGMGGACAAVISIVEFNHAIHHGAAIPVGLSIVMILGLIIGSVSFSGSMIAYGKLEEKIKDKALPFNQILNIVLLITILALGGYFAFMDAPSVTLMYVILGISLIYGICFVIPIGGADMPVVISLLNSFTGMAAAFGGFLYGNQAMLTGGILVGSAGTILTILMCNAMNRSLMNVIIGSFGGGGAAGAKSGVAGSIKEISVTDAAVLMSYSQKVAIVPGYGLAVAQAQHVCHELEKLLEEKGVEVFYAIHPVAGRMPGHMNVLLAEADVPYPKLLEMEEANAQFPNTDVVLVIGANDVVNPAARKDTSSPIYGMPILNVDEAKNIIVMKRSMGKGYAGIENELFFHPKNRMLFGDAKTSLQNLVAEVKAV